MARYPSKVSATKNTFEANEVIIPVNTQIRNSIERGIRANRGIFNGTKGKLGVNPFVVQEFISAGWHLHIFNDDGIRIQEALNNGYEFVTNKEIGGESLVEDVVPTNTDLGDKVRYLTGRADGGEGTYSYLMKIPESWWLEDQAEQQKRPDKIDQAIKAGKNNKEGFSSDTFYNAGIQYQN